MSLIFTIVFFGLFIAGITYLLFKIMNKIYHWVYPFFETVNLNSKQVEVINLVEECIHNKSYKIESSEEDLKSPGKYTKAMLVFNSDKFSLDYEYNKTKHEQDLSDVNMIMFIGNSKEFVDANSLKSINLMKIVEKFLINESKNKKIEKEDFLLKTMKSRKDSHKESE